MKQVEINITGRINNDGKLAMYMQELNDFCRKWKNARVVASFKVYQPGTSAALRGYYYNYVVPVMRRAIWDSGVRITEEQTERHLRELSPIMQIETVNPETGKYTRELREIKDLSNNELIEHIETWKQIAAEEYSVFIEDPNSI